MSLAHSSEASRAGHWPTIPSTSSILAPFWNPPFPPCLQASKAHVPRTSPIYRLHCVSKLKWQGGAGILLVSTSSEYMLVSLGTRALLTYRKEAGGRREKGHFKKNFPFCSFSLIFITFCAVSFLYILVFYCFSWREQEAEMASSFLWNSLKILSEGESVSADGL